MDDVFDIRDDPSTGPRTTSSLLAALLARAATLQVITGAQAMASISSGLCRVGREFSLTIEGRRVREALIHARPGRNLQLLFDEFGFGAVAANSPPTPLLQDFHNDLALLLSPDLDEAIDNTKLGASISSGFGTPDSSEPIEPVDFLVGLWAYSCEIVAAVEALVNDLASEPPEVESSAPAEPTAGRLLR